MTLPSHLRDRLRLPLIAAPMTDVSGPRLVIEACRAGVIGTFPTHNARTPGELNNWLNQIRTALKNNEESAPFGVNLVVHKTNQRLDEGVALLVAHSVELVITSVGSPVPVLEPLHDSGCVVFADVASMRHVERALDAGVDGLVLLTAGAGGQTGWANPLAFIRAVRATFDGPIVLAGGISDGTALWAAEVAGADLAYMGTKFIATTESLASDDFRAALVQSSIDDVTLTTEMSGLPANFLASWLATAKRPTGTANEGFEQRRLLSARGVWSAGHSTAGVTGIGTVAQLVAQTTAEYESARRRTHDLLAGSTASIGARA